jgi:hypothetical protein
MDSWLSKGYDVVKIKKSGLPIIQQMQMIVGAGVSIGSVLALTSSKWFAIIPLFFGCGLILAGLSGICLLLKLLAKMPWNKV